MPLRKSDYLQSLPNEYAAARYPIQKLPNENAIRLNGTHFDDSYAVRCSGWANPPFSADKQLFFHYDKLRFIIYIDRNNRIINHLGCAHGIYPKLFVAVSLKRVAARRSRERRILKLPHQPHNQMRPIPSVSPFSILKLLTDTRAANISIFGQGCK